MKCVIISLAICCLVIQLAICGKIQHWFQRMRAKLLKNQLETDQRRRKKKVILSFKPSFRQKPPERNLKIFLTYKCVRVGFQIRKIKLYFKFSCNIWNNIDIFNIYAWKIKFEFINLLELLCYLRFPRNRLQSDDSQQQFTNDIII